MSNLAQLVLIYTLPFLVVLTLVVTVHELGHFLTARLCKVAVERFSIGFGKPIVSWKDKQGTSWWISWIPLGGYVKFAGDENIASVPDAEDLEALKKAVIAKEGPAALKRYFHFKPLWQRSLIVAAGPVANFILAVVVFAALAMTIGEAKTKPFVGQVQPNSPAAHAGLQKGDLVVRAEGRPIKSFDQLQRLVVMRADTPIRLEVQRGGKVVSLVATPGRLSKAQANGARNAPIGLGYLGIVSSGERRDIAFVRYQPIEALQVGVRHTVETLQLTVTYLGRIFTGHESGSQISGMLGMGKATGEAVSDAIHESPDLPTFAKFVLVNLAGMAAFISVALGFANLLPIPVLDGGHLLFYGYEAVARRPLAAHVQDAGYRVGFALVIALMLFGTFNDLRRFGLFQFLGGLFS